MSSSDCPVSDTELEFYSAAFPLFVKSPASSKLLFLGGAGFKGLDIEGRFKIFNVVGVYLDCVALQLLSVKWKGKTAEELTESDHFFREIITGPFEKLVKVFNKLPFAGKQYSEKVTENCVANWKTLYTEAEAKAVEKFLEFFKDQTFPPGSSILFAVSPDGSSLTVAFSNDHSIPETGLVVTDNKMLAEAVLEYVIDNRLNLAKRLAQLMNTD